MSFDKGADCLFAKISVKAVKLTLHSIVEGRFRHSSVSRVPLPNYRTLNDPRGDLGRSEQGMYSEHNDCPPSSEAVHLLLRFMVAGAHSLQGQKRNLEEQNFKCKRSEEAPKHYRFVLVAICSAVFELYASTLGTDGQSLGKLLELSIRRVKHHRPGSFDTLYCQTWC